MTLSATQLSLCFQSYWYLWLTNGLSGLFFIGIDIGIAAFFMSKFSKKKPPANKPTPTAAQTRAMTPVDINSIDPTYRQNSSRNSGTRSNSALLNNSGTSDVADDFAHATYQAINAVRSQYDASPVELDDQLSNIAQDWANQMAESGKLEHRPLEFRNFGRQALGENLIYLFQKELTADRMVRRWMKEGRTYRFGTDGTRDTSNFTQLIWQGSREIGVGRAQSADGHWWYGVVVFDPPGNIPSRYAENVKFQA